MRRVLRWALTTMAILTIPPLALLTYAYVWNKPRPAAVTQAEVESRLPRWISANEFEVFVARPHDDPMGACTFAIIDVEFDTENADTHARNSQIEFGVWQTRLDSGGSIRDNETNASWLVNVFKWLPSEYYTLKNVSLDQASAYLMERVQWYVFEEMMTTLQNSYDCPRHTEYQGERIDFSDLWLREADYVLIDISRPHYIISIIDDGKLYYLGP